MNEKKFHKKIENDLSCEEREVKSKVWQKISGEINSSENCTKWHICEQKRRILLRYGAIAVAIVVLCAIIPIFQLNISRKRKIDIAAGSDIDMSENISAIGSVSSGNANSSTINALYYILSPRSGKIVIDADKKYFLSDDGSCYEEITESTQIFDADTRNKLGYDSLTENRSVVGYIVTVLGCAPYEIGDLIEIRVY